MRTELYLSQAYALMTVVFWSSAYVFTKVALACFSVPSLAFLRCAVASFCLGCVLGMKKTRFPGVAVLPRFVLSGAVGFALYIVAFNKGATLLNATTSCIIISTSPIITALLARVCYGERLRRSGWVAIITAFCGICVMTLWDGSFSASWGILWTVVAAVLISVYNILQRSLAPQFGALTVTAWSFFAGTILLLPFLPAAMSELQGAPTEHIFLVCFLGVCPSAAAYLLWAKALSTAPRTSVVTNYMFLTPFLALLLEYAVTGAVPGAGTFIGGALILASLALFTASVKNGRSRRAGS